MKKCTLESLRESMRAFDLALQLDSAYSDAYLGKYITRSRGSHGCLPQKQATRSPFARLSKPTAPPSTQVSAAAPGAVSGALPATGSL